MVLVKEMGMEQQSKIKYSLEMDKILLLSLLAAYTLIHSIESDLFLLNAQYGYDEYGITIISNRFYTVRIFVMIVQ